MQLIVDAGATKSAWTFVDEIGRVEAELTIPGINFSHQNGRLESSIPCTAYEKLTNAFRDYGAVLHQIHFYGAGLLEKPAGLEAFFAAQCRRLDKVEYASDLLGAARAVCGRQAGIAAILGTGSNSCLYDGEKIVRNIHSSGFILGDEGGGAALGKAFMADFLKELVPAELAAAFAAEFPVDYGTVVKAVYRSERPAAYLASFAPWILGHYESSEYVRTLVEENFRSFARRALKQYGAGLSVGVVGGFAKACEPILRKVLEEEGMTLSVVLANPVEGLIRYHINNGV